MNWLNTKIEKFSTNKKDFLFYFVTALITMSGISYSQAWEVDLSRRIKVEETKESITELRWPSSTKTNEQLFSDISNQSLMGATETAKIISVLHTEEGFIPDTLRLRKEGLYKIHIVNVNEKFKNSSFIMDAFGQSFGTYFGKPKSFEIKAKVNGIFTFLCPETGAQGKIIVFSDKESTPPLAAIPSSEAKK